MKVDEARALEMKAEGLVDETTAAKYLGISVATLRLQRCKSADISKMPRVPYVKFGRTVRYRPEQLKRYVDANAIGEELGAASGG